MASMSLAVLSFTTCMKIEGKDNEQGLTLVALYSKSVVHSKEGVSYAGRRLGKSCLGCT